MKLKIDTDNLTVELLEPVNLNQLIVVLKRILGKDYEKYLIKSGESFTPWVNPVIVPYYIPINPYPYTYPIITYGTGSYNIELQQVNTTY